MRALSFSIFAALSLVRCAPTMPVEDAATAVAQCASCHPDHVRDHSASRHARAAMGELYTTLRDRGDARTRSFCDSCHRPAVGTSEGLSCESCHRAVGNSAPLNAMLRWDPRAPLSSAREDSVMTRGHSTRFHGFLPSSELCGTCHEVQGPGAFRETPFTEWQRSPAARANTTCVQCHGSPTPGRPTERPMLPAASEPGVNSPPRARTDHHFIGPDEDDPAVAERLLRDSAAIAVTREGNEAVVTITSRVMGHSLPTGVRAVRELWLELSTFDATGTQRVLSGALDPSGGFVTAEPVAREDFHDELSDGLPTLASIVRVRAIEAGATRTVRFSVDSTTSRVRARLRYRSQSQRLRAMLGMTSPAPSPIEIAQAELVW